MAILMAMGYIFKQIGFFSEAFVRGGMKLCFYVLLSSSLFKNLYDSSLADLPIKLIVFVLIFILLDFAVGVIAARILADNKRQKGIIIQGIFRSNFAYIGIPLASMMFTQSELVSTTASRISLLSMFVIPVFNVLSVIALIVFNENKDGEKLLNKTIRNIAKNPCIISIFLGIMVLLFRSAVPSASFFIKEHLNPIYKVIGYFASMSTPLSLILVGASLDFSHSVANIAKLAKIVAIKNLIYPAFVLVVAYLLMDFDGPDYASLVSTFATSTAVASAVMATELDGDGDLASEIVIYTTLFSIFSLLIIIYGLKAAGCL
ncbi:MAG: AEC family transporter [Erysipelotrichaceae bacterium]|nr:AEC family transporter [Erysipelotrichaceae bacterium]